VKGMGADKIEITGVILAVTAILVVFIFISQNSIPAFKYANENWIKIEVSKSLGPETANFIWNYRSLDLITQAFVLFGAATGCLAILREKRKEEKAND